MDIATPISEAGRLLFDPESGLWEIVALSLLVSASAVALGALIGLPLGYALGTGRSRATRGMHGLVNTGMSLPPVVAGLFVFMLLSRSGPLGELGMLYSRQAMVLAQFVIATPLVAGVTAAAIASVPLDLRLQARSLGANRLQEAWLTVREARRGVAAAIIAGFGAVISEVGAVMLVGGNIEGSTRVMTTAIVLETRQGRFGTAVALGLILVGIAMLVNGLLTVVQHSGVRYER